MIFLDSNVPMYLVGREHPNRSRAASLLRGLVARRERLVSSAEVEQEILHRYHGLGRLRAADDALETLHGLVDEVAAVQHEDVHDARRLLRDVGDLSSRDALHVAVAQRLGCRRVLSFDAGFDLVEDIERLH